MRRNEFLDKLLAITPLWFQLLVLAFVIAFCVAAGGPFDKASARKRQKAMEEQRYEQDRLDRERARQRERERELSR